LEETLTLHYFTLNSQVLKAHTLGHVKTVHQIILKDDSELLRDLWYPNRVGGMVCGLV